MEELQIAKAKEQKSKENKIFWTRFSFYVFFAWLAPGGFLIWRFNLFNKINSISIGGWGLVFIIFSGAFFIHLMKQVKKGLPYSLGSQILEGYMKVVIPLLIVIFCVYTAQEFIKQLLQFLIVLVICEAIAIPMNPFPKWIHDNHLEESQNKMKKFADIFWSSKE